MLTYSKALDVRYDVDIFVAGGGPSGLAAAVTAAIAGKSVYLAEASGCFGGGGTSMLVPYFCKFTNEKEFLSGGFGREVCVAYFGEEGPYRRDWPMHAEKLKRIYDRFALDAGFQFTFFTRVLDVLKSDAAHVSHVLCGAKTGLFLVKARYFLDCTGDADLCAFAGADYEMGDENGMCMGSSLCSTWASIDWSRVHGRDDRELERAFADHVFQIPDRHLPGIYPTGRTLGGGNIGHAFGIDATDECSVTRGMLEGRRYTPEYERYYQNYLEGFEQMELTSTAPLLGIRESRRITCDYRMTRADFIARRHHPDDIGAFSYPIDIHESEPTKEANERFEKDLNTMVYAPGEHYGIPYRALTPVGLKNVLVAGRSICTDRSMLSSIRVMPCCFITGQAIGMAAAMAPEDVHSLDVPALQARLLAIGAVLYPEGTETRKEERE